MPYSSPRKTRWYSDSDPRGRAGRSHSIAALPVIELRDVSLRFVNYADKQYSLKRAVLDLVLRRPVPVPVTEFWALRNLDLRINRGERVGILGGNGAGKSTLLRLLARIYPPTSGTIEVHGNVAP
ncbi:MAG: ABC transporter ATP-binding protein, partial [Planctomycetaceae bacterium]|nr:ABC transporter ATP-binding protein [Planctomycetaceae bacterium]